MFAQDTLGIGVAAAHVWSRDATPGAGLHGEAHVRRHEAAREVRVWWRARVANGTYFIDMTVPIGASVSTALRTVNEPDAGVDPALALGFQRALHRAALALCALETSAPGASPAAMPRIAAFLLDHLAAEQSVQVALTNQRLANPRPILTLSTAVPRESAFYARDPTPAHVHTVQHCHLTLLRLADTRADMRLLEVAQWIASLRAGTTDHELPHMALARLWIKTPAARLWFSQALPALQLTLGDRSANAALLHLAQHATSDAQCTALWIPETYTQDADLLESLHNMEFILRLLYALLHSSSLWTRLIGSSNVSSRCTLGNLTVSQTFYAGQGGEYVHDGLDRIVGSRIGVSRVAYARAAGVLDQWVCKLPHHPVLIPAGMPYYALTPASSSFVRWGLWKDATSTGDDLQAFIHGGYGRSLYDLTRYVAQTMPRLAPIPEARQWIDERTGTLYNALTEYVRRHVALASQVQPDWFLGRTNLSRCSVQGDGMPPERRFFIPSKGLVLGGGQAAAQSVMRASSSAAMTDDEAWACQWAVCMPYLPEADKSAYRRLIERREGLSAWMAAVRRSMALVLSRKGVVSSVLEAALLETMPRVEAVAQPTWSALIASFQKCATLNVPTESQMHWIARALFYRKIPLRGLSSSPQFGPDVATWLPPQEHAVALSACVAWDRVTMRGLNVTYESMQREAEQWLDTFPNVTAAAPSSLTMACYAAASARPDWMARLPITVYVVEASSFSQREAGRSVLAFQHLLGAMSWAARVAALREAEGPWSIVRYRLQGNAWIALDALPCAVNVSRRSLAGELCIPHATRELDPTVAPGRAVIVAELPLANPNHPECTLQPLVAFPAIDDVSGALYVGGASAGGRPPRVPLLDGGILSCTFQ